MERLEGTDPAKAERIKVLELFSGVGGMHYALEAARIQAEVVAAIDISEVANKVYRHNFPEVNHQQSNICGLTAKKLNKLGVEAILMSPPCQPFTRQGKQKDVGDPRTQPLLHILQLIPQIERLKFILVENVKGFENSEARDRLVAVLKENGFNYQEFLVSPTDLGIPNSRLRYYLIASKDPLDFPQQSGLIQSLETFRTLASFPAFGPKISDYLEDLSSFDEYKIKDELLLKRAEVIDIITAESDRSCCITKSYGRYAEGTGSILQQSGDLDRVYQRFRALEPDESEAKLKVLDELKLRYLTPREISRLMGFPQTFQFPPNTPLLHCYRVLGNSLNVAVVGYLLKLLMLK